MDEARKQFDFATDFLIFVTACFFALGGISRVAVMQESLHHSLMDKGLFVVTEDYELCHTGEELLAMLCLSDNGISSLVINGTVFEGNISSAIGLISAEERYSINRKTDENGKLVLFIDETEMG